MYIVIRTDQGGGYLAPAGSHHSYTKSLTRARTFASKEAAEAECCENERVARVDDLMIAPR